jgi:hypothetical protein
MEQHRVMKKLSYTTLSTTSVKDLDEKMNRHAADGWEVAHLAAVGIDESNKLSTSNRGESLNYVVIMKKETKA